MLRTIFIISILMLELWGFAQYRVSGTVIDKQNKTPLAGAHVQLGQSYSYANDKGSFTFTHVPSGTYTLKVSFIGYTPISKTVKINNDLRLDIAMDIAAVMEDAVEITAHRAYDRMGTSFTNLSKADIKKADIGTDIPYLLNMTPGLVSSSDGGNGIGYTSLWIRGTDMTRINVTLNGIPLNDPESQGVYFVDIPDFAGSMQSAQIQRGVGTSVNGPSAFGASIDLQTNVLTQDPQAEINYGAGSFGTQKFRLSTSTGLINKHYSFDVRLSKMHTDGFIDRAFADMSSYFVSGAWYGKKSALRINVFSGKEKTYQAWYGVPKDSLEKGRTYNPYTYDNETDNYQQTHYQIFYKHRVNARWRTSLGLHLTDGKGYYENYKADRDFASYGLPPFILGADTIRSTDLIQQKWLDNRFYGMVLNVVRNTRQSKIILGGAYNIYDGQHFGNIIWASYSPMPKDYQWYRNTGVKKDFNVYAKIIHSFDEKLNVYGDLQYRIVDYTMQGIHDDLHDLSGTHHFSFINPKAGINYSFNGQHAVYASLGIANREPSRSNYKDADEGYQPKAESLTDLEMGYAFNAPDKILRINFYYMNYHNQLVLTGKVNNVGEAIMTNVDQSFRRGIELIAGWQPNRIFDWNFNMALSQNKIQNFTAYVDDWDNGNQIEEHLGRRDIAFSPSLVLKNSFNFHLFKRMNISLLTRYVSRRYIDNTSSLMRSLDPYLVNDLRWNYSLKLKQSKALIFSLAINNLLNEQYESNAWVYRYKSGDGSYDGSYGDIYSTEDSKPGYYNMAGYFPQAGIHFMATLTLKL